jgi:single-strand DNA-binding protein
MVGNLTRDIELRYLSGGGAVAKSAIATSNKYKTQSGEQREDVCFLDFQVFGRSGEVLNQYVKKGSKVLLEGKLVFDQWKAQDGTNRSKHSLTVENFKFLDSKADSMGGQNQSYGGQNSYGQQNQQQYGQPQMNQPQGGFGGGMPQQEQYPSQQNDNFSQPQSAPVQSHQPEKLPEIDVDEGEIPF